MNKIFRLVFLLSFVNLNAQQKQLFLSFGSSKIELSTIQEPIKDISCGSYHCYFTTNKGELLGVKDEKALGLQLPEFQIPFSKVATGDIHSLVLTKEGNLVQFFSVPVLEMFYPNKLTEIREVSSGSKISCALNNKNILFAWGADDVIERNNIYPKTYGVKTASLGSNHVAFINIKDKVFVWGDHSKGQNQIPSFYGKPKKIVSGDNHVVVLDSLGKIYAWGNNDFGQTTIPEEIEDGVTRIYAKANLTAAIVGDTLLYVWGKGAQIKLNIKELGVLNTFGLGTDFAVLSIYPKALANNIDDLSVFNSKPKEEKGIDDEEMDAESFFQTIAEHNFGQNNFQVVSESSQSNGSSDSEVVFEGSGNNVKIINEGMTYNLNGGSQRVIFKGSNNQVVIKQRNKVVNSSGGTETIVIDLDQLNNQSDFSEYYEEDPLYKKTASSKTSPTITINDPNKFYDPLGSMEYYDLEKASVFDGLYYFYYDGIEIPSSDHERIRDFVYMGCTDEAEATKALIYIGENEEAIERMIENANIYKDYYTLSQLYHVFKGGLLGFKPDPERAKQVLEMYCARYSCYSKVSE